MSVSVVIPWRDDGSDYRRTNLWQVEVWWRRHHPDWQLIRGTCSLDGPWVKAHAVGHGVAQATGELLVIADADVICRGFDAAVRAVQQGRRWAVPHTRVIRLTAVSTAVYWGQNHKLPQPTDRDGVEENYTGVLGGGAVVLPRGTYLRIPLDPRFAGYGQEDASWGIALTTLFGLPWRGLDPLWHLWHPPQPRQSRALGSQANRALYNRYRAARNSKERMSRLISEYTAVLC